MERSQEDFARIHAALEGYRAQHVVLLVLTLRAEQWPDTEEAFRELRELWRPYAKAIRRQWGKMEYVATVERHRSGLPHLNVIVCCEGMADDLRVMPKYVRQWCKDHAAYIGFGPAGTFVDVARSREDVAGYVVKLADRASVGEVAGETVGEVVKMSQLPRNAPKGFRRLRSSKGFLPDLTPESEYTGELERFPHPQVMTEEQRERWRRSLEVAACEEAARVAHERLAQEQRRPAYPRVPWEGGRSWDRRNAPGLERVLLEVSPVEGEEFF